MANIDLNTRVIQNVNSEDLVAVLNGIIDAELNKDIAEMNTVLIDDCVDALLEIEKERNKHFAVLVPFISPNEFLRIIQPNKNNWKNLSVFARAGIVAAVLASTTITVNAAYKSVTGNDLYEEVGNAIYSKLAEWGLVDKKDKDEFVYIEKTTAGETTNVIEEITEQETSKTVKLAKPQSKTQIDQFDGEDDDIEEITTRSYIDQLDGEDDDDETTTRRKPVPTTVTPVTAPTSSEDEQVILLSLSADYSDDFKLDYIYGETLSYDGLTLTAHYSDGSSREVKLSECNYTKSVDMTRTADYTLRIIYEKCVITIDITVRPDDYTRGAEICENDLYDYMLTSKGAYITKYKGSETVIDIDTIDGSRVVAIGANVFDGLDITDFSSENCEKIFGEAFKNCTKLETCYTPRVKYIGSSAFENDAALSVPVFNYDLSYIGTAAYKNSGIKELYLTPYIKNVPDELCENCADLTTVDLRGAETVGKNAFSDCISLKTVNGTDGLTEAYDFAFYNCSQAEFENKPAKLTYAGTNAFAYCNKIEFGKLYITAVSPYAFAYCHNLTEVEIDGKVRIIPEGSFRGTHLEKLTLNEGTQEIDDTAFMSTSITEVYLPSSVTRIGTYGLYSVKLKDVYCTKNLKTIETSAFFRSKLTLHVYKNSYAHNYAIENNIKYEIIDDGENGVIQLEGEDD
ncbi:MAG: hypothetical protein E7571_07140 [Ruminococcaceae bacterium]|nr:hypothetical protein [Oscillospiraceae bacterium]